MLILCSKQVKTNSYEFCVTISRIFLPCTHILDNMGMALMQKLVKAVNNFFFTGGIGMALKEHKTHEIRPEIIKINHAEFS